MKTAKQFLLSHFCQNSEHV